MSAPLNAEHWSRSSMCVLISSFYATLISVHPLLYSKELGCFFHIKKPYIIKKNQLSNEKTAGIHTRRWPVIQVDMSFSSCHREALRHRMMALNMHGFFFISWQVDAGVDLQSHLSSLNGLSVFSVNIIYYRVDFFHPSRGRSLPSGLSARGKASIWTQTVTI